MQFQTLLVATALAATASATPLRARQASYSNANFNEPLGTLLSGPGAVPTPTPTRPAATSRPAAVSEYPQASDALYTEVVHAPAAVSNPPRPSGTYIPAKPYFDGYGNVNVGNFSLNFCPVERTVTITRWLYNSPEYEKYTLACPNNGASYEVLENKLLPANEPLQIHGGNLCTSNLAQYYLLPGRMYENLWFAYGNRAVDVANSSECENINNGEAFHCTLPIFPAYTLGRPPTGPVSGVSGRPFATPKATTLPSQVIPKATTLPSEIPRPTAIPSYAPAAYSQAPVEY